jgi:hypothetical protein
MMVVKHVTTVTGNTWMASACQHSKRLFGKGGTSASPGFPSYMMSAHKTHDPNTVLLPERQAKRSFIVHHLAKDSLPVRRLVEPVDELPANGVEHEELHKRTSDTG